MTDQRGFNLIEISVALLLGGMMFLWLGDVFVSIQRVNQTQSAIREMHFSGVYGIDLLSREIRRAGFSGCMESFDQIRNFPDDEPPDAQEPGRIPGPHHAVWGDHRGGTDDTYNVESDRLRIRYLQPLWHDISERKNLKLESFHSTGRINTNRRQPNNRNPTLNKNDTLVLTNCDVADYFRLNDTPAGNTASLVPQPPITDGATRYPTDESALPANLYRNWYIEYFVHRDDDGIWNLYRRNLETGSSGRAISRQPMIRDVEKLEVHYGIDTGNRSPPDDYMTAADVNDWDKIRSIRLTLHFRNPGSDPGNRRNFCGGADGTPDLCSFRTTILLRNRI